MRFVLLAAVLLVVACFDTLMVSRGTIIKTEKNRIIVPCADTGYFVKRDTVKIIYYDTLYDVKTIIRERKQ